MIDTQRFPGLYPEANLNHIGCHRLDTCEEIKAKLREALRPVLRHRLTNRARNCQQKSSRNS